MKKSLKLLCLLLLLCLSVTVFLMACDEDDLNDDMEAVSEVELVSIDIKNVPEVIYIGEFDDAGIIATLNYADGTTIDLPIYESLFSEEYKALINTPGTSHIEMLYRGVTISFDINMKEHVYYTVKFYNANNDVISTQQVQELDAAVEPNELERNVSGYKFLNWDKDFDVVTSDMDIYGQYVKLYTVKFFNGNDVLISEQEVEEGKAAVEPSEKERAMTGYIFVLWDLNFSKVTKNLKVYGLYMLDTLSDIDGDGLSNYWENKLGLDPSKADSDADGIADGNEDNDGDGLSNAQEISLGTDPTKADTDGDGLNDGAEVNTHKTSPTSTDTDKDTLTDYEEVNTHHTDPLKSDTDGDGAKDAWEIANGYDPLVANTTFSATYVAPVETTSNVTPSVSIPNISGVQIATISIEKCEDSACPTIPGAISSSYDYSISGNFDTATISFSFDSSLLSNDNFDPTIAYYNEAENKIEMLETTVNGNVASATVNHFSIYTLVDRTIHEQKLTWTDTWEEAEGYDSLEVVLVVDDSGSMDWNDASNKRFDAAKGLIDGLPAGSKIGVVRFESSTTIYTSTLITDRTVAKSYFSTSYFKSSGGTYMYTAINDSFNLFSSDTSVLKLMIVLSDGDAHDTRQHSATITTANSKDIKVCTIGLGSSSSYFTNYLKPLAEQTDGIYQATYSAEGLKALYDLIGEKIDLVTDSDGDGLTDFCEDNMNGVTIGGVTLTNTDKNNPDSDGDGLLDGEEISANMEYRTNPDTSKKQVAIIYHFKSDPNNADDPGFISWEYNNETGYYEFTCELNTIQNHFGDSVDVVKELLKDSDGDGLCDFFDGKHLPGVNGISFAKLSSTEADYDGDGINDGDELVITTKTITRRGKNIVIITGTLISDPTTTK